MSFDNMQRFLMYCAYAFGVPLFLTIVAFLLSTLQLIPDKFNTNIGNETCSIGSDDDGRVAQFIYVYCPIIVTISINIVFYTITAYKIYCVQKETAFKGSESKRHAKNEVEKARWEKLNAHKCNIFNNFPPLRFFLYVRLFVIMGISWIFEVISWYFKKSGILYAVSILNCMQGIIIFMLFVWKSKIQILMARK